MFFVEGTPAALLAVEFTGASEAELNAHLDRLAFALRQAGWPRPSLRLLDPAAQATVWDVRKAGLGILMSMRGDVKPIPCIEDVSVPVANLPCYVADVLDPVSYTHLRAHETVLDLVCRLLLEKKKNTTLYSRHGSGSQTPESGSNI